MQTKDVIYSTQAVVYCR